MDVASTGVAVMGYARSPSTPGPGISICRGNVMFSMDARIGKKMAMFLRGRGCECPFLHFTPNGASTQGHSCDGLLDHFQLTRARLGLVAENASWPATGCFDGQLLSLSLDTLGVMKPQLDSNLRCTSALWASAEETLDCTSLHQTYQVYFCRDLLLALLSFSLPLKTKNAGWSVGWLGMHNFNFSSCHEYWCCAWFIRHTRRRPAACAALLLPAPAKCGHDREVGDAQWPRSTGPPHLPEGHRLGAAAKCSPAGACTSVLIKNRWLLFVGIA
eukprot:109787-Pelagomonas_calceolata.AAC.6